MNEVNSNWSSLYVGCRIQSDYNFRMFCVIMITVHFAFAQNREKSVTVHFKMSCEKTECEGNDKGRAYLNFDGTGVSVKEITKLEKTSLSDFTLCGAELLPKRLKQLEESLMRFFQTCTDSLIVCAGCVGMTGRLNKNEQCILSDMRCQINP